VLRDGESATRLIDLHRCVLLGLYKTTRTTVIIDNHLWQYRDSESGRMVSCKTSPTADMGVADYVGGKTTI